MILLVNNPKIATNIQIMLINIGLRDTGVVKCAYKYKPNCIRINEEHNIFHLSMYKGSKVSPETVSLYEVLNTVNKPNHDYVQLSRNGA